MSFYDRVKGRESKMLSIEIGHVSAIHGGNNRDDLKLLILSDFLLIQKRNKRNDCRIE